MKVLFTGVMPSLREVKGATKENVKDKVKRAKILRTALVTIGDYIKSLPIDDASLEVRIW